MNYNNVLMVCAFVLSSALYASDASGRKMSPYEQGQGTYASDIIFFDQSSKLCGGMALMAVLTGFMPTAVSCPVCALHIGCACAGACAAVHLEDAKKRAENRLEGDASFATDAIGKWIDGFFGSDKRKQQ